MSEKNNIDIEQHSVVGVLDSHWIIVPTYQRDYAWEKQEVQEFLNDITNAIANDDTHYFLGTIVTITRENDRLEVVDGQQRLATTALTLAAMRNVIADTNANFVQLISGFLSKINSDTLEHEIKISLNVGDEPVFSSLISHGDVGASFKSSRSSHQNLRDAYNRAVSHFKNTIDQMPTEAKIKWLQSWVKYLQFNTTIILMKVSDDATAFRMFETLNDRGLEVSRADLIKNYIFGKSASAIEEAQNSWSAMREVLEAAEDRDSTMNFIWHVLITTTGTVEQKNIYERVKNVVKGKQSATSTLSEWQSLTHLYTALSNPENSYWIGYPPKLHKAIRDLNILNIQQFKPLLMAIGKRFSQKEAANSFSRVVSMGVRLFIASRTTTQSVWAPLGEAANRVWNKQIVDSKELISFLSPNIPNDQIFKTAFETATVTKSVLARYYLRTLHSVDPAADPSLVAIDDHETLNLEHILPSNPQGNWPQFTDDEVAAYVKRIGNLALLTTKLNSDAKSDSFENKKRVFASSQIPATAMVAKEDEWNVASIDGRQKYLAELALKAWPLK